MLLGHSNKNLSNDGKLIFEGVGDNRNDVDELMYILSSVSNDTNHITFTITPDKVRSKVEKVSGQAGVEGKGQAEGEASSAQEEVLSGLTRSS